MYNKFYGLARKPFSLNPDPDFLYRGKTHQAILSRLEYGLTNNLGIMVVTGDVGTGKSVLMHYLLSRLEYNTTFALLTNTHYETLAEMLLNVLMAFDVDPQGENEADVLHLLLNDFFSLQFNNSRKVLLFIDEAQNLSHQLLEDLRLLSNFTIDNQQVLQLVLIGQPVLKERLASPGLEQLNQRISVFEELMPMDRRETHHYILHRLEVAGGTESRQIFSREACDAIFKYSGGIPGLINILGELALMSAYAEERRHIDSDLIEAIVEERKGGILKLKERDVPIDHDEIQYLELLHALKKPPTGYDAEHPDQLDTEYIEELVDEASAQPERGEETMTELSQQTLETVKESEMLIEETVADIPEIEDENIPVSEQEHQDSGDIGTENDIHEILEKKGVESAWIPAEESDEEITGFLKEDSECVDIEPENKTIASENLDVDLQGRETGRDLPVISNDMFSGQTEQKPESEEPGHEITGPDQVEVTPVELEIPRDDVLKGPEEIRVEPEFPAHGFPEEPLIEKLSEQHAEDKTGLEDKPVESEVTAGKKIPVKPEPNDPFDIQEDASISTEAEDLTVPRSEAEELTVPRSREIIAVSEVVRKTAQELMAEAIETSIDSEIRTDDRRPEEETETETEWLGKKRTKLANAHKGGFVSKPQTETQKGKKIATIFLVVAGLAFYIFYKGVDKDQELDILNSQLSDIFPAQVKKSHSTQQNSSPVDSESKTELEIPPVETDTHEPIITQQSEVASTLKDKLDSGLIAADHIQAVDQSVDEFIGPVVPSTNNTSKSLTRQKKIETDPDQQAEKKKQKPATRQIIVKKGDRLKDLVVRYYGEYNRSNKAAFLKMNPGIRNEHLIIEGEFLTVPAGLDKKRKIKKSKKRTLQDQGVIKKKIENLLKRAESQIAKKHLTTPAKDSAWKTYQSILKLQPGQEQALAGKERITKIYVSWGQDEIVKGNLKDAEYFFWKAQGTAPDDEYVKAALEWVKKARNDIQMRNRKMDDLPGSR